jgi:glycosyltransferase involved in cell wall biosynthesis
MSKLPRVSVVMPTFNRAKELPRSIRSVLSQTFSDLELIIVDDASSDNTEEVIASFNDERIRYKKLLANVGGAEARNVGVSMARAEIVAFQDSDDEWACAKLEKTLAEFKNNEAIGAVFSKFIQIWEDGCRLMPVGKHKFQSNDVYKSLLWQNHVDTPTLVVKKCYLDEVGGFTSIMPRYQDWDLALKLARVTTMKYLHEPTILSYVTEGSITENSDAHCKALELIYELHRVYIDEDKALKADWLYRIGDAKISTGVAGGRKMLLEALKCAPMNLRYFVKFIFSIPENARLYNQLKLPFKA